MNTISIQLMDGSFIPCSVKEQPVELVDNSLSLDTTGEYLQVGRRKPVAAKPEEDAGKQAGQKLFYEHAFFFLAHRKRILSDSRMFLAPVPIQSGLAYAGTSGFMNPTLGVYLEFWTFCHIATRIDENDRKSLVCRIAGSPLTGDNKCDVVYEDGSVEGRYISYFSRLWHGFVEINKRYDEAKATCESYTLQQVVDELSKEGLVDYDKNAVDAFFYKRAADYWKTKCTSIEDACDRLRKDLLWAKMETKPTQLTELVSEVDRQQAKIDALTEKIRKERRMMLNKLHANEMTPAEYQRWWMALPIRKEEDEAIINKCALRYDTLKRLFPDDYMHMSLDEVREFVKSLSENETGDKKAASGDLPCVK